MRHYLMLASTIPSDRLLTIDMLRGPQLRYRGDLTIKGREAKTRASLPHDTSLLCIDQDWGDIYRPEGGGLVTALGNVLEHLGSRPVLNAVYHGDAANLVLTTRHPSALAWCMNRAKIEIGLAEATVQGAPISLFQPQLITVFCEVLRHVADVCSDHAAGHATETLTFRDIITTIKVDHSTAKAA